MTIEEYYDENLKDYRLLNLTDPATARECMKMMESYHAERMRDYENITMHDLFEFYKDSDKSNHTFNSSVLSVIESLKGEKG